MKTNNTVELVVPGNDRCGEGPVWDFRRQAVVWTDIPEKVVYQFDPRTGHSTKLGDHIPAGGITLNGDHAFLVAALDGAFVWTPDAPLKLVVSELAGQALKFNDIIADHRGRVYAGTYYWGDEMERPGELVLIDTKGKARIVADDIAMSNGLGFSPDQKTLYFSDSARRQILAFDVNPATGDLTNRRVFVSVPQDEGLPDGLTVDADGCVWSAQWYGSQVVCYDSDGRVKRRIPMPVRQVSSVTFGGKNFDELYITSAGESWKSRYSPPGYDYSATNVGGGLYRYRPGVAGVAEHRSMIQV